MEYQCPKCYSYEIAASKSRNILPWIVLTAVLDAVIVILYFTGIIESLTILIIMLVVVELLFLPPLLRSIMSGSQTSGGRAYRCTECGYTWLETDAAADSPSVRAEGTPYTGAVAAGAGGDSDFRMTANNVFGIRNRGAIVVGTVESGSISKGDTLYIHSANGVKQTVVDAIQMFEKTKANAVTGDNVGMLLRGVNKSDVHRGDILKGSPH